MIAYHSKKRSPTTSPQTSKKSLKTSMKNLGKFLNPKRTQDKAQQQHDKHDKQQKKEIIPHQQQNDEDEGDFPGIDV